MPGLFLYSPSAPVQTGSRISMVIREKATDEPLIVTAASGHVDDQRRFVFDDGVEATCGPSKLTADHLIVQIGDRKSLKASGKVRLIDPDISMEASNLTLDWDDDSRNGHAERAIIEIAGVHLSAATIDLHPTEWVLNDVDGSSCNHHPQLYSLHARRLVVHPGIDGVAEGAAISMFGRKLGTIPRRKFNLQTKTQGINIPLVGYRKDVGYGITWSNGYLVDPVTNVSFDAAAFPGLRPGVSAMWTRSLLPAGSSKTLIAPQSDLKERFGYAYSESVENGDPHSEVDFLHQRRHSISIGASVNESAVASLNNTPFTKLGDLAHEFGGPIGTGGFLVTSRLQFIKESDNATQTRGIVRTAFTPGYYPLSKNVSLTSRIETGTFIGTTTYGWTIANLGLVYESHRNWNFMVNGFTSKDYGTPLFDVDQLYAKYGFDMRLDFKFGGTAISLLDKWDRDQGKFDLEFAVSQVSGCVEPFLMYRRFPRDYRIGVRLRMDGLYDVFGRRSLKRPDNTVVVSSQRNP